MFHHLRAPCRQAEGLYCRALEGGESELWPQHPDTLTFVTNLALVLERRGKLEEAGPSSFGVQRGGLAGSVERKAFLMWPGRETGEFSCPSFTRM